VTRSTPPDSATGPDSAAAFELLSAIVLGDEAVQNELLALRRVDQFAARVSALANDHGLALSPPDVVAALATARRAWYSRWV